MTTPDFIPFPKIPRLRNELVVITEKLNGTNAQILITPEGEVHAGSRNRWITPGKNTDNYGFAAWVEENKADLRGLGAGRHFGEWYGYGVGPSGYGLPDRRWALFNTFRPAECLPPKVQVVTKLYEGTGMGLTDTVARLMEDLKTNGSKHVPGYMRPEGLVVYSCLTKSRYKVLCENDDIHKGQMVDE